MQGGRKAFRSRRARCEERFFAAQTGFENEIVDLCARGRGKEAMQRVIEYTCANMDELCEGWRSFAFELIGKHHDGGVMTPRGAMVTPGYPSEWLEKVDFGATSERDLKKLGAQKLSGSFSSISP